MSEVGGIAGELLAVVQGWLSLSPVQRGARMAHLRANPVLCIPAVMAGAKAIASPRELHTLGSMVDSGLIVVADDLDEERERRRNDEGRVDDRGRVINRAARRGARKPQAPKPETDGLQPH